MNGQPDRIVRAAVSAVLAAAAVATFVFIHDFGQSRFFTVDEYQYGHATWLVAQGRMPYVDFYEHHFPLFYVLAAPLLPEAGSFVDRALYLRELAFATLAVTAIVLLVCALRTTRELPLALLIGFFPFAFGFGLMSEIDYRADNFAACAMVACLAVLDANRRARRVAPALAAGALLALAAFATQKMVFLGGGPVAALILCDLVRGRRVAPEARFVARPFVVCATAASIGVGLLAVGASLGLLEAAFETTIVHTIAHEAHYLPIDVWQYVKPFLAQTPVSTAAIAAAAVALAVFRSGGFWWISLAVVLAGTAAMKAPFPYNFVYPGLLLCICAALGLGRIVAALRRRRPSRPWTLLYLLPLAALPDQLDFVAGRTSNAHQLQLLRKVEAFTTPADKVIDGAGGALFRPHGSYYWYHGHAHRRMFGDYFADDLVADYRNSAALFWIDDFRQRELPDRVRSWFGRHYVYVDGDLYALGFATPATGAGALDRVVDVLRAGDYRIYAVEDGPGGPRVRPVRGDEAAAVSIGDRAPVDGRLALAVGRHRLRVGAGSPRLLITPLPPEAFDETIGRGAEHAPLFEYDVAHRPAPAG